MTDREHKRIAKTDWHSPEIEARVRKRYGRDRLLKFLGIGAIGLAIGLLGILIVSLTGAGYTAFVQTKIKVEVFVDPAKIKTDNMVRSNFRHMVRTGFADLFPEVTNRRDKRDLQKILSPASPYVLRDIVLADHSLIGKTIEIKLPAADAIDQLNKGVTPRDVPEDQRKVNDKQIAWFDALVEKGLVSKPFNWGLFFSSDSRFPEQAGLGGAIMGSFYALLVCFLISFPTGIAAAIYLEEFAAKNKWTDTIEANINNLAAVPSIVFGLLGLAVFLGTFGLPRSAPLVGGMTLALMTLPTIIIATRLALKAVPPSIREAAYGVGASKHQVVIDHVLPLALPGILTGTIIGLARALGETAPLLLIGMNAFITSNPGGILDPATSLPTQIFIWADSPERGFVAKTSAAIVVLLGFLFVMNGIAIYLRQKFERKW